MRLYSVEYYDKEDKAWIPKALDLCHGNLLCPECQAHPEHRDTCDHQHYEHPNWLVAEQAVKTLRDQGYEVRINVRDTDKTRKKKGGKR